MYIVAQVELRRVTWCSSLAPRPTLCLVLKSALMIIHGIGKAAKNRGIHQVGTGVGTQPQTMMEQSCLEHLESGLAMEWQVDDELIQDMLTQI